MRKPTMNVQDFARLFDYMYWANCQMLHCVGSLNETQVQTDLSYSIGSVQSQLAHMVSMDNLWINYLWHGEVEFLNKGYFKSLNDIYEEWQALEEETRDYLSTLTNDDLERTVTPAFLDLPPMSLRDVLLQIINHATDHRAQVLAGIHHLGGATVEQDYSRYLAQAQAA